MPIPAEGSLGPCARWPTPAMAPTTTPWTRRHDRCCLPSAAIPLPPPRRSPPPQLAYGRPSIRRPSSPQPDRAPPTITFRERIPGPAGVCPGRSRQRIVAGQESQNLANGALPACGLWQREVRLDLVAVTAAVLLLDDVPGLGQVSDNAVGAALGDVEPGRDIAEADARVLCDAQQDSGVVGQEGPARGRQLSDR